MTTSIAPTPSVGAAMPDIALIGPDGRATTLHRVRGDRRAVVYFLRTATCPVCRRHARTLAAMAEAGELGPDVDVLLVAPGGADEATEVAARVPSRAVTAWSSGTGHAAVGLGTFLSVRHSGTFAVDGDGTVLHERTAALPPQSFSRAELLHALAL